MPKPIVGRRILVVDDDPLLLRLVSGFLEREGFRVDASATLHAALRKIRSMRYALLIADLRLGNRSGVDLILQARALDERQSAILISGYLPLELERRMDRLGNLRLVRGAKKVKVLKKPFSLEELRVVLRRMFRRQHRKARGKRSAPKIAPQN